MHYYSYEYQDPEDNGIEIYCDRPREEWQFDKNLAACLICSLDQANITQTFRLRQPFMFLSASAIW
jgi:catechol-2,3-dioxygenase